MRRISTISSIAWVCLWTGATADPPTDDQALAANVAAVVKALEQLQAPLAVDGKGLKAALAKADGNRLQELLDAHALLTVSINPESRVKVARGKAPAELRQDRAV